MSKNYIVRRGHFDAGHRVMFQKFKCAHLHGHRYDFELKFSYQSVKEIGYAIDFSEIKRVACAWIDELLDHSFIVNPVDTAVLELLEKIQSKKFVMHLLDNDGGCNPTVENIAKEVFFSCATLLDDGNLRLEEVKLFETENCIGICQGLSDDEILVFKKNRSYIESLRKYKADKGAVEYDSRK